MVSLNVFNKSTRQVVVVIQGPCAASCEHAAGHVDEQGLQPYCSSDLGWSYGDTNDGEPLLGIAEAPVVTAHPLDTSKPVGSPGGPHRMSQEQFDDHLRAQRKQHDELAAAHGLKVKS